LAELLEQTDVRHEAEETIRIGGQLVQELENSPYPHQQFQAKTIRRSLEKREPKDGLFPLQKSLETGIAAADGLIADFLTVTEISEYPECVTMDLRERWPFRMASHYGFEVPDTVTETGHTASHPIRPLLAEVVSELRGGGRAPVILWESYSLRISNNHNGQH